MVELLHMLVSRIKIIEGFKNSLKVVASTEKKKKKKKEYLATFFFFL